MEDIKFIYNDNCSDVSVITPTENYNFIEYMSKKSTKDFFNIRNYKITYYKNCGNVVVQTTTLVAPNYNLNVEIQSCTLAVDQGDYVFKLTGINPDFVSTIETCDATYTICFPDAGIIKTSTYVLFGSLGNIAASPTTLYFKVNTIDGFEYRISFVLTQVGATNCDYTLGSFTFIYDLPTYLNTPTSELSLNLLFNQTNLDPGYYNIKICEIDSISYEVCFEDNVFIDCEIFSCPESFTCNPTDDNCQLMLDVIKKHQSLEYGIKCCGEYSQNILKFYIKLYCPKELNC